MAAALGNPDRMARLLLSTGSRARGMERPMRPVEVALAIRDLCEETGEPPGGAARRLNIHEDTCRMFLSILDMPEDWWGVWGFGGGGTDGAGGILPVSLARSIGSRFKAGTLTLDDMNLLKGAILDPEQPARRDDVTAMLSCHRINPGKPMEECITEIMNLRPVRITSYVVTAGVDAGTVRGSDAAASARGVLEAHLPPGSLEDVRIPRGGTRDGRIMLLLLLSKDGYDALVGAAKRGGVPVGDLIGGWCKGDGAAHG